MQVAAGFCIGPGSENYPFLWQRENRMRGAGVGRWEHLRTFPARVGTSVGKTGFSGFLISGHDGDIPSHTQPQTGVRPYLSLSSIPAASTSAGPSLLQTHTLTASPSLSRMPRWPPAWSPGSHCPLCRQSSPAVAGGALLGRVEPPRMGLGCLLEAPQSPHLFHHTRTPEEVALGEAGPHQTSNLSLILDFQPPECEK